MAVVMKFYRDYKYCTYNPRLSPFYHVDVLCKASYCRIRMSMYQRLVSHAQQKVIRNFKLKF